jgi:benzoyl-CoA reductase/2-hydroxyglutaryl-CoA dehydratase subunit BcrC/BadD/HgdB
MGEERLIGYTCCYTPLLLINAAGFTPYRVLPVSEAPDQAATLLHDNLCPQVKRTLDRALAGDLPELQGMVVMSSCDAMRRLADAWKVARPDDRLAVVDLPPTGGNREIAYFAGELERLVERLAEWRGQMIDDQEILASATRYNRLAVGLARVAERAAAGTLAGGWVALQELRNRSVTRPYTEVEQEIEQLLAAPARQPRQGNGAPILIFGNVLPDPQVFELLADCGAELVADDLCTGSRQLLPVSITPAPRAQLIEQIAAQLLSRPPCARTIQDLGFAQTAVSRARECGARGVIIHLVKFCDPYLARLPAIRQALREADLPVLVLEGDCSLRSFGQHRTRIEAFVEMVEGRS